MVTDAGQINYRLCVVAMGSGVNFFNTTGAAENSYTVRTLEGATKFHQDFVSALESNQNEINISIIGGGYTGIEVTGQLMSFVKNDVVKLYPNQHIKVRVIENTSTILTNLPVQIQKRVSSTLQAQGVEFMLGSPVTEVRGKSIVMGEQELKSDFTIWCAGVKNNADQFLLEPYQEKGRVVVNGFLQHPANSHLYAIGDIARFCNPHSDTPVPPLGEVAYKEGEYVARHIIASLRDVSLAPFHFSSRGMLIPIGDSYGILTVGTRIIFGKIALLIRKLVYLHFMPGVGNKLKILLDWTLHHFGFRCSIQRDK